jgi:hypothetical protein
VVRGIGVGLSNREIARRLRVAETTVKSCTSSILAKLDVRNRVEVALTACRVGLVPLHPRPGLRSVGDPAAAVPGPSATSFFVEGNSSEPAAGIRSS